MSQEMKQKLIDAFQPTTLEIVDESHKHAGHAGLEGIETNGKGTHFKIKIISSCFLNKSRIDRHRLVHEALQTELKDHIHALSLILLTPEESQ